MKTLVKHTCWFHETTLAHYFRIWKHVPEKFSNPIMEFSKGGCVQLENQKKCRSVAGIAPKFANFLCFWAASTYLLCLEVSLCLLLLFSPPCSALKSRQYTVHKAKPSPFRDFWMNLDLLHKESLNFTKQFFSLIFFKVPILIRNYKKIGLKWKQNSMSSRRSENHKIFVCSV